MPKEPKRLKKPRANSPWKDDHILTVYELAKDGLSEVKMASALGVAIRTFRQWRLRYPLFHLAIKRGKSLTVKTDGTPVTFGEYVFNRLPDDLKSLWEEIHECQNQPNGVRRMEALFSQRGGMRARQHLFLYAFTSSGFNASKACQKIGISCSTLDHWINHDPDFPKLMDEIHWHKGNLFETALIRKVQEGDTSAIIHTAKTFNKDRGYGVSKEINVKQEITHNIQLVSLTDLQLPIDVRIQLLNALRDKKEKDKPTLISTRNLANRDLSE